MSALDRPFLVYSDYCIHSKNFLQMLMKYPDIYNSFIRMNIDVNPQTKQRPVNFYKLQEQLNRKIVRVPTIVVTNKDNQILLLSDTDAFKWLDFQVNLKKQENEGGIKGFNLHEMGSFSDGYSSFDQNNTKSTDINNATEQNFKFFKNINGKRVLVGEQFQTDGVIQGTDSFLDKSAQDNNTFDQSVYSEMEKQRSAMDQNNSNRPNLGRLEQFKNQSASQPKVNESEFNTKLNAFRQQHQGQKSQVNIDFTNPDFGLSKKIGGQQIHNIGTQKIKETDARLEQIMMDRKIGFN